MTQPFNEQDHPRGGSPENPGTFSEKQHADADVTLPAAPAFDRGTNATFGAYDFGGYSYKKLRTMRGEETPAFEADIILEGKAVGGIYSDGLGGMPLPRWASREDRERFETHIRERVATATGVDPSWAEEGFWFDLLEETEVRKKLTSQRRRGHVPLLTEADLFEAEAERLSSYRISSPDAPVQTYLDAIRERYARYWNGERWARLDEPDTFGS